MSGSASGLKSVLGCAGALFWSGAFIFGFPGVMAPYWKTHLNVSQGAIGSIMFFVLAGAGIFMFSVGKWQEILGIRRTITIGVVITSLNVLLLNFASDIYIIYVFAFIAGASSCLIYVPSLTCVQRWYPEKRGLVSGAVNVTFGLSAGLMSPMFLRLLDSIGYENMIYLLGVVSLVSGILSSRLANVPLIVEDSTEHHVSATAALRQMNLDVQMTAREIVGSRAFRFLWLTWALQGSTGVAMVSLSTAYGISKNYPVESAVMILVAFNLASGAMRLISGMLSDYVGRNLTMSVSFTLCGMACIGLINSNNLGWMCLFSAFIGFAFATLFTVSAPLITDCFGIQNFGAVFGLVFTAYGFFSGPLGPVLSGFILDMTKDFSIVFYYLSAFSFLAGVLILFVRPTPVSAHN